MRGHLGYGRVLIAVIKETMRNVICLSFCFAAGVVSAAAAVTSYTYDEVGRVTSAIYDNGSCLFYTYDANGNRTAVGSVANPSGSPKWGTATWGCFAWTSP